MIPVTALATLVCGKSRSASAAASSARLKARWRDPVQREAMLAASAKGVQRAAELIHKRQPTPADPALRSKFNLVRSVCGIAEARRAFGLEVENE